MAKKSKIVTVHSQILNTIENISSIKDAIKRGIQNSMFFKTANIMTMNLIFIIRH